MHNITTFKAMNYKNIIQQNLKICLYFFKKYGKIFKIHYKSQKNNDKINQEL